MTRYFLFLAVALTGCLRGGFYVPDCDPATTVCPDTDPVYPRWDSAGETGLVETDETDPPETDPPDTDQADTDTDQPDTDPPPPVDSDGDGYTTFTDCNDGDPGINPGAPESCNGVDDNCDTQVDEDVTVKFYADVDGDLCAEALNPGDFTIVSVGCEAPAGTITGDQMTCDPFVGDCNDANPAVYAGAPESCNGVDDDCDGSVDEGVGTTSYGDVDGDGFGAAASSHTACSVPTGYVTNSQDCNDASAAVSPNGTESCNNVDDDCDGSIDEGFSTTTYYRDADADGFGTASSPLATCAGMPSGYAVNSTDCNDTSAAVSPSQAESCDGLDNDCDGSVDEGFVGWQTYYRDADGDQYGDLTSPLVGLTCYQPAGYVSTYGDCDDSRAATHPGAPETCNLIDDDCDGTADDACQ